MPLMPFTSAEHVIMLLEGTKQQTTRLPRKHPIKIGETLYCYFKPRHKKGCTNCIVQDCTNRDRLVGDAHLCESWNNYFGEAKVIRTEHYWSHLSFPEVVTDGSDHWFAQFAELITEKEGKELLEEWSRKDGFIDFKHADQWFVEHHGADWMQKDLDVITFEPKWLAKKVA